MLGVVMALTAITLFLVAALLAAKVKRRKRAESKVADVMPLSEFRSPSAQSSVVAQTQIGHRNVPSTSTTALSMSHGRSQHTVMTQLSEENSTGMLNNRIMRSCSVVLREGIFSISVASLISNSEHNRI